MASEGASSRTPGPAPYLDLAALAPRLGPIGKPNAERIFVVGRSGSGKTHLATAMLDLYGDDEATLVDFRARICIFDPNRNFDYAGRRVYSPADVVPTRDAPVILYRPTVQAETAEGWNEALRRLFLAKGRVLLLIDEFTALDTLFSRKSIEGGNYLTAYMGRGRAMGKAAIVLTQAPANIPLTVIRNAERFAVFDLPLDEDRDRMTGVIGRYTMETRTVRGAREVVRVDLRDRTALGRYQFWYYGPNVTQAERTIVKG